MSQKIDYEAINQRLLSSSLQYLKEWLPSGKKEGDEWVCGDVLGNKGKSFKVNIKTGKWADFASDMSGGDLVSLYKEHKGIGKMSDAANELQTILGITSDKPHTKDEQPQPEFEDVIEVFPEGVKAPVLELQGMKLVGSWDYHNKYGDRISTIQRYDNTDGDKQIRPWRVVNGKVVCKHLPTPRPLWNLNEIAKFPDKGILIVEGEKAAIVGKSYFSSKYVCTTWSGGANAVGKADWSPLTGRKNVLIIPDADEPGWKAALEIADILVSSHGVERDLIYVIDTTKDFPKGWDIADHSDGPVSLARTMNLKKLPLSAFQKKMGSEPNLPSRDSPTPEDMPKDPFSQKIIGNEPVEHEQQANPYFRFLGIRGTRYYFYKYTTSQIFSYSSKELGEEGSLVGLAPLAFWDEWTGGKKTDWSMIRNALIGMSENFRYDPRLVRKMGLHRDEHGNVAHLGDKLLLDGAMVPIKNLKSRHIYEYSEKCLRVTRYAAPLPASESSKIIEICEGASWLDPVSGKVLAGWLFSCLAAASMRWRSHIYIVGPAGSGKSWLLDNVIGRVLRDFKYKVSGNSTEASIRQGLDNNVLPIIFDESEAEDASAGMRRKAVFELARQASSADEDSPISKGSVGGNVRDYYVRSPFLFASINTNMEYADETRTTYLRIVPIKKNLENREKFRGLNKMVRDVLTEDFTVGLLGRALKNLDGFVEGYEVFKDAMLDTFALDSRHAEQMAFMVVGAWFLEHDKVPTIEEAKVYSSFMATISKQRMNVQTTEERLISAIAQTVVRVNYQTGFDARAIGELVSDAYKFERERKKMSAMPEGDKMQRYKKSAGAIQQMGIRVINDRIHILNDSQELRRSLRSTPFYGGWDKVIINVINAEFHDDVQYTAGIRGPSVSIPVAAFLGKINEEKSQTDVDNPI